MSIRVGAGVLFSACASIAGDRRLRSDEGTSDPADLREYSASRADRLNALSPRLWIIESVNRVLPAPLAPIMTKDMAGVIVIVWGARPSLRGGNLSSMS